MKCGFVSIVGRPNVGKSTLLNSVLGMHLAITSNKVGTTRNIINGIYNDDDSQIVFVDTPGVAKPIHKMNNVLNKKAYNSTDNVDLILFLTDISTGIGKGDKFLIEKIKKENEDVPIFLLLNKIDKVKKEDLLKVIDEIKDQYDFKEIIPISALKEDNIKELIKTIKEYLPEQDKIYDEEELTNVSTKFIVSELVREKVLALTDKEIPHAITCYTEEYEELDDIINITVVIVVDRDNIKKIIIGKKGNMLKEIGTQAREDIEKFLGKKVYLKTHVKTIKNWRDREKYLIELGISNEEE